ncbi:MAG: hypothetical protein PHE89_08215 [Alphaproteobacteria bacterium]|nr:hypothetical protein [Alphaproteobacteria bacterium]
MNNIKTNYLALMNVPIEDVVDAIRQLRRYCETDEAIPAFKKLDIFELVYLLYNHQKKVEIPLGLYVFMMNYLQENEGKIHQEIVEDFGVYWESENNFVSARKLYVLTMVYFMEGSVYYKFWSEIHNDLLGFALLKIKAYGRRRFIEGKY